MSGRLPLGWEAAGELWRPREGEAIQGDGVMSGLWAAEKCGFCLGWQSVIGERQRLVFIWWVGVFCDYSHVLRGGLLIPGEFQEGDVRREEGAVVLRVTGAAGGALTREVLFSASPGAPLVTRRHAGIGPHR